MFPCNVPVQSCQVLMKPEFSRQIFEKQHKDIKFHENPPVGEELLRVDRWTDMRKLMSLFLILRIRLET